MPEPRKPVRMCSTGRPDSSSSGLWRRGRRARGRPWAPALPNAAVSRSSRPVPPGMCRMFPAASKPGIGAASPSNDTRAGSPSRLSAVADKAANGRRSSRKAGTSVSQPPGSTSQRCPPEKAATPSSAAMRRRAGADRVRDSPEPSTAARSETVPIRNGESVSGVLRKLPDAVAVAGVHGKAQGFQRKNLKKGIVREREGVGRERAAQCASVRVLAQEDQPEHEPAPGHAAGPCGQQRTGGAHPPPAQRAGAAAIQMDGGDECPHERGALGPAAGVEGPGKECFRVAIAGSGDGTDSRPVGHGPAPSWAKPFLFETAFFQRRSTPKAADETGSNQTQTEWENGTRTPSQQVKRTRTGSRYTKKLEKSEGRAPRRQVSGEGRGKARPFLQRRFPSLPQYLLILGGELDDVAVAEVVGGLGAEPGRALHHRIARVHELLGGDEARASGCSRPAGGSTS